MKLGEKIKKLRNDAGYTQPELAEKANIEQSYLSKLENDKGSPSFDVISKIANAFEMDVMNLVDSLDINYLHENLAHLPEIAMKLEQKKLTLKAKFKRGYAFAASLIVLGIALVILGNSNTIFPQTIYQYKSMGLIKKGELNNHFTIGSIHEINESREERAKRIASNVSRIDEMLVLTSSYQGEGYVDSYNEKRRFFKLIGERHIESPWRDICLMIGYVFIISGVFGMVYIFKFRL